MLTSANALGGIAWINPVEGQRCPFWTLLLWRTAYCEGAPRAPRAEAARSLSPSCNSGGRYTRLSLSRSDVAAYAAQRAGGAYDSHHRTAGIAGRTRRRGGCVPLAARAASGRGRVG